MLDDSDPAPVTTTRFADVDPNEWWAPYVERLAELEVTDGCKTEPLRFCPGTTVKRGQMATFLVRALDLAAADPAGFTDTDGSVHTANIDALAAAKVTLGCETNPLRYCPGTAVKRGQMAAFLARALGTRDSFLTFRVCGNPDAPVLRRSVLRWRLNRGRFGWRVHTPGGACGNGSPPQKVHPPPESLIPMRSTSPRPTSSSHMRAGSSFHRVPPDSDVTYQQPAWGDRACIHQRFGRGPLSPSDPESSTTYRRSWRLCSTLKVELSDVPAAVVEVSPVSAAVVDVVVVDVFDVVVVEVVVVDDGGGQCRAQSPEMMSTMRS